MPTMKDFMGNVGAIENISYGIISIAAKFARPFLYVLAPGSIKELDLAVKAANALHALVQTSTSVTQEAGATIGFLSGVRATAPLVIDMIKNPKAIALLSASLQGMQDAIAEGKVQVGIKTP